MREKEMKCACKTHQPHVEKRRKRESEEQNNKKAHRASILSHLPSFVHFLNLIWIYGFKREKDDEGRLRLAGYLCNEEWTLDWKSQPNDDQRSRRSCWWWSKEVGIKISIGTLALSHTHTHFSLSLSRSLTIWWADITSTCACIRQTHIH